MLLSLIFSKLKTFFYCDYKLKQKSNYNTSEVTTKNEKSLVDYFYEMKLLFEKKNNIEDSFILVNRNSFEECLLFSLLYVNCSDVMFRELARNVKESIKKNNFEQIRSLLYQAVFMKNVPNVMSGGYDHSGRFFEAMGYISCLGFDSIYRCFPKDIPLCTNGYPINVINSNLLLCILYNNGKNKVYDDSSVVAKAEKRLLQKSDKALCGVTMCLLGILKHDVVMFNEGLPQLLCNYNRLTLLNACEKTLCQLAISLVVIARKFLTEDEFDCIVFPEAHNFSWNYCKYMFSKPLFEPKIFYKYPGVLAPLNELMLTTIPKTKLTRILARRILYEGLDENEFDIILDEEQMFNNFIIDYKEQKQKEYFSKT